MPRLPFSLYSIANAIWSLIPLASRTVTTSSNADKTDYQLTAGSYSAIKLVQHISFSITIPGDNGAASHTRDVPFPVAVNINKAWCVPRTATSANFYIGLSGSGMVADAIAFRSDGGALRLTLHTNGTITPVARWDFDVIEFY
jgi:hypothetical protein